MKRTRRTQWTDGVQMTNLQNTLAINDKSDVTDAYECMDALLCE